MSYRHYSQNFVPRQRRQHNYRHYQENVHYRRHRHEGQHKLNFHRQTRYY